MIKTRGQMYEIALCTIDPEPQISSLAKLFFQELAQRNNGLVIYNAMPDIISHLSGGGNETSTASGASAATDQLGARAISEESFRTIVTYLFTFIKRDKQCETLIEKLCQGFRQANASERKCRDLAFCLSKIQLSENGIKKLKETFKLYADKLTIPMVYDTFKQVILRNARKLPTLRNETKLLIDELEKQIDEVKQKGIADDLPGGQNPTPGDRNTAQDVEMSETESNAEEVPSSGQAQAQTRNSRQVTASASKPAASARSSRNVPVAVTKKGGKTVAPPAKGAKSSKSADVSRARRKVVVESSSDDDTDQNEAEEEEEDSSDSD
jgi:condensin complex subunit 1